MNIPKRNRYYVNEVVSNPRKRNVSLRFWWEVDVTFLDKLGNKRKCTLYLDRFAETKEVQPGYEFLRDQAEIEKYEIVGIF